MMSMRISQVIRAWAEMWGLLGGPALNVSSPGGPGQGLAWGAVGASLCCSLVVWSVEVSEPLP